MPAGNQDIQGMLSTTHAGSAGLVEGVGDEASHAGGRGCVDDGHSISYSIAELSRY